MHATKLESCLSNIISGHRALCLFILENSQEYLICQRIRLKAVYIVSLDYRRRIRDACLTIFFLLPTQRPEREKLNFSQFSSQPTISRFARAKISSRLRTFLIPKVT